MNLEVEQAVSVGAGHQGPPHDDTYSDGRKGILELIDEGDEVRVIDVYPVAKRKYTG